MWDPSVFTQKVPFLQVVRLSRHSLMSRHPYSESKKYPALQPLHCFGPRPTQPSWHDLSHVSHKMRRSFVSTEKYVSAHVSHASPRYPFAHVHLPDPLRVPSPLHWPLPAQTRWFDPIGHGRHDGPKWPSAQQSCRCWTQKRKIKSAVTLAVRLVSIFKSSKSFTQWFKNSWWSLNMVRHCDTQIQLENNIWSKQSKKNKTSYLVFGLWLPALSRSSTLHTLFVLFHSEKHLLFHSPTIETDSDAFPPCFVYSTFDLLLYKPDLKFINFKILI